MRGDLAAVGKAWSEMLDGFADWNVVRLRDVARLMEEQTDRAAMIDVEGAREWRDLIATREPK